MFYCSRLYEDSSEEITVCDATHYSSDGALVLKHIQGSYATVWRNDRGIQITECEAKRGFTRPQTSFILYQEHVQPMIDFYAQYEQSHPR